LKLITHCGGGSFKSQFKHADRSGATWSLILGDDEINKKVIGVKAMATGEQETVSWDMLANYLQS
jgi:histidyl-tRNA synthetase